MVMVGAVVQKHGNGDQGSPTPVPIRHQLPNTLQTHCGQLKHTMGQVLAGAPALRYYKSVLHKSLAFFSSLDTPAHPEGVRALGKSIAFVLNAT